MIDNIKSFRFWCQKVLPLVYDNSLSYYEVLCKVVHYLNHVIEGINEIPEYIDEKVKESFDDEHISELISEIFITIEDAITNNNEGTNTHFSKDYQTLGTLLWHDNKLYRTIRKIDAGDTILVGTNIELVSFGDMFEEFLASVKEEFSPYDDGQRETASANRSVHTLIWLDDELYEVIKPIIEGNAYIYSGENQNVEHISLNGIYAYLLGLIADETQARIDTDNILDSKIDDEAQAREEADTLLDGKITDEAEARKDADDILSQQISELSKHSPFLPETRYFNYFNVKDSAENTHKALADFNLSAIAPINVLDYGLVNDGNTDNSAALNELLSTKSVLYFPDGEYLFSSNINIPSSKILKTDNAILKLDNTATIYIHSFTTLDGFTINCLNENNAIILDTLSGNVLNTLINNIIINGSNIGIKDNGGQTGAGMGHIGYNVKFIDVTINSPTGTGGFVCGNMFGFIYLERCVIDFTQMSSVQQYYGFYFTGVEGITFNRCDVLGRGTAQISTPNSSTAFYLQGSAIWLDKCMVDTVAGFGFNILNSTYVYLTNCISSIMGNSGIFLDTCVDVQIDRCFIYGTRAIEIGSIGYCTGIILKSVNNATITNISITEMNEDGIKLTSCEHVNITGGRIRNCNRGIIETNYCSLCMFTSLIISCITKQIITLGTYDIVSNLLYESGVATQYNQGTLDI